MKAVIVRQDIPGLVISAIIGLALTFLGAVKLKNAIETRNWPVANGTVTSSEVGGTMKYYPSVSYTYIVDSTVYTSNRISSVILNTKDRSVAEGILKKYPVDSELKVFYSSEDPSNALLEPGIHTVNIILLVFGVVILAIPLFSVFFMKFKGKDDSETQ